MAKTTAIFNQKGGVGKTTTAINLAAGLGRRGDKVLLVDMDSQGNATSGFGIDKQSLNSDIFKILIGEMNIEDSLEDTSAKNVKILPGTIDMAGLEAQLYSTDDDWPYLLKSKLEKVYDDFDHIIIDCPPSLGINSIMSLVASDYVLITIQTEFYALEGTSQFMDTISMVQDNYNEDLSIIGVLLVMYDGRTRLSKDVKEEVESVFGDLVFNTVINRNVRLGESPSYGLSIFDYDNISRGAWNYRSLTREYVGRLADE